MQVYAGGGVMSAELLQALMGYEVARIDGGGAEGIHRDIQALVSKSPGSKLPFWSASIRLEQNVSEWQALDTSAAQERYLSFFADPARLLSQAAMATTCLAQETSAASARLAPGSLQAFPTLPGHMVSAEVSH